MLATGGLLTCVALLTLAAVAPLFRRSDPPRWTTYAGVGEAVTLAIVCTLALGVGYLGAGALDAFQTRPDYLDLGLLAGVALVAVVIWRGLKARAMATAGACRLPRVGRRRPVGRRSRPQERHWWLRAVRLRGLVRPPRSTLLWANQAALPRPRTRMGATGPPPLCQRDLCRR